MQVEIYKDEWDLPKIFNWIKDAGNINMTDMYKIFGIGYVFIVSKDESDQLRHAISNEGFNFILLAAYQKTNKEDSYIFNLMKKIIVLISGSGSNLQAIDQIKLNNINASIECVISNKEDAYGL